MRSSNAMEWDVFPLRAVRFTPKTPLMAGVHRPLRADWRRWNSEIGGPSRTRTYDQGIHVVRRFPGGVDYLITLAVRWGAGRSSLLLRAL